MLWEVFLQIIQLFQAISGLPSSEATGIIRTLAPKNVATWILKPEKWFKSFSIHPPHDTSSFCGQSGANFYIRTANPKKKNGSAYYYPVSF